MKTSLAVLLCVLFAFAACSRDNSNSAESSPPPTPTPPVTFASGPPAAQQRTSPTHKLHETAVVPTEHVDLSWIHARAGNYAYLEDDGGSATAATVCGTVEALRKTFDGDTPASCVERPRGTLVQIIETVPDHAWAGDNAIADVHIRASEFSGWVTIMQLEPIIPPGTTLRCANVGNATPEVFPELNAPDSSAIKLGSPVHVALVKEHPYSGDADWYVRVLDGPKAGMHGYMVPGCNVTGTDSDAAIMPWNTKTGAAE